MLLERAGELGTVIEVALDEGHSQHVAHGTMAAAEVVVNHRRMPALGKPLDRVRPDVPRAAGNKHLHKTSR